MRLEVNHPLYALSWICGAESIVKICKIHERRKTRKPYYQYCFQLFFLIIGIALLPVAIIYGSDNWHMIHDQYMMRVHDQILEFLPPYDKRLPFGLIPLIINFGLFPLSLLAAIALIFSRSIQSPQKIILVQLLVPTIFLGVLYAQQNRWSGLFATSLIILALTVFSAFISLHPKRKVLSIIAASAILLFLVPGNYFYIKDSYAGTRIDRVNRRFKMLAQSFLAREIALSLYDLSKKKEIRIMAENSYAPMLAYFGVGRSVGSLYWPNQDGVLDTAMFYADLGDKKALEIAKKRGLTHAVFELSPDAAERFAWTLYGTEEPDIVEKTLAYRISKNPTTPPEWLTPVPIIHPTYSRQAGNILYQINIE